MDHYTRKCSKILFQISFVNFRIENNASSNRSSSMKLQDENQLTTRVLKVKGVISFWKNSRKKRMVNEIRYEKKFEKFAKKEKNMKISHKIQVKKG